MRRIALVVSCLLCVGMASGAETVRTLDWSELEAEGLVQNGEVLPAGERGPAECLKVLGSDEGRESIQVLNLNEPEVGPPAYAITGEVSYEEVGRQGYLEMWSYFPDASMHFTKTLAETGPMAQFTGSSDWRPFTLPFTPARDSERPERLLFLVILPEGGTVYLRNVKLMQYDKPLAPPTVSRQAWWTERQAGWIGGISGAVIGLWGSLIGILAGLGKAHRFVIGSLIGGSFLGGVIVVMGLVALAIGQPWAVYYPFLLIGVILTIVPLGPLHAIRRRYQQRETGKTKAEDAG